MGIKQATTATDLATHLKRLREERGLTLVELCAQSGVSRASLSRIENAEVSPTAETLGRLATAFGLPVSQLLRPMEQGFQPLLRRGDQASWSDPEQAFHRRSVSPPNGQLSMEMIEVSLGPDQEIAYDAPAVSGQEHHVYILSGQVEISVEGVAYDLRPGDCLRYVLLGATRFRTAADPCTYLIALK